MERKSAGTGKGNRKVSPGWFDSKSSMSRSLSGLFAGATCQTAPILEVPAVWHQRPFHLFERLLLC